MQTDQIQDRQLNFMFWGKLRISTKTSLEI